METFQIKAVVQSFLDSGMIENGFTEDELASLCHKFIIEISRKSLKKSYQLAKEFVKQAGKFNGPLKIASYKTLATVAHLSGDYTQALKAYQNIKKYSGQDKLLNARIDRALIDVSMYLGDYKKAGDAARRAIRCFEALNSKSDLAMTRVNFANTLHRRDRHREAEKLYHQAEKYFIKTNNKIAEARCSYNRANTLVQQFDIPKAEKLYKKAQSIYLTEDNKLDANDALYGLAWLHMLSGDFHIALLELSECEKTYHDSGDKRSETLCILDKAEIYLGLGLYSDSLELSRIAESKFKQLLLYYEKAKSAFFRAQAAHALFLKSETRVSLKRAKVEFLKENNHGFLGAVYLLESDIQIRNKLKKTELLAKARKSFSKAQLPLWSVLCDFRELENPKREKTALTSLKKNGAVEQVPHLYAHWQVVLGDNEFNQGRIKSAQLHWQKAADKLDLVRAELPPVELRNKYAHDQSSPHIRLIKSELDGQPIVSAAWSERYKTAGIWAPLSQSHVNQNIRKKTVESLDALARRVAALSRHIGGDYGERKISFDIQGKTLTDLRIKLQNKYIELEKRKISSLDSINKLIKDFKSVSNRIPIVQFHVNESDIITFIHENGKTRINTIKDGREKINLAMRKWRYLLESELLTERLGRTNLIQPEKALWSELGQWLWSPLEIGREGKEILLLPEGELANIPWSALIVNGYSLIEKHNFIVCPSLRHFIASENVKINSDEIKIFRGAAEKLPYLDFELNSLAELVGNEQYNRQPCRRKDWPSDGEYKLWHYSGHASLRSDNPFYSSLALEDGPLFAVDFRFKDCKVGLVTLASCRSGEQLSIPGEESTGFVRSLLEMGSRQVVASLWPVSDKTTAKWMHAFYKNLFKNKNVLAATRFATDIIREDSPSAYHWSAFTTFGACS